MRLWDMWFYEDPDNYVHEYFICNYKYLVAEICVSYKWECFYQLRLLVGIWRQKSLLKVNS